MYKHTYVHKVCFYETDKMAITHHSNYIRWMEEARISFLDSVDLNFKKLESMGLVSPVLFVSAEYKDMTEFDENIEVEVFVKEYNGLKLVFEYEMYHTKDGKRKLCATATSGHCFLDAKTSRPVILSKFNKDVDDVLRGVLL